MGQVLNEQKQLNGLKVLIADDSDITLTMLKYLVEEEGAESVCAENGAIAIDKVKAFNFDLILMDINMPVCDGVEATETIRAMSIDTPIIAVTSATKDEVIRLKNSGFTHISHKPVEFSELLQLIASSVVEPN